MSNLSDRPAVALLETAFPAHGVAPPPRNPRRLRRSVRPITARSVSASISEGVEFTAESGTTFTSDKSGYIASMSTSSDPKRASYFTRPRSAIQDVSPPSSPDVAAGEYSYVCDEVSPIDEFDDLDHSYYMTGARSAPARENRHPPRHSSRPRSHQMQFGPPGSHKEVEIHTISEDQDMTDVSYQGQQMSRDPRLASHSLSPEAEQPGRRGSTPYVPRPTQQQSSKSKSPLESPQSLLSRLPALEIPDSPKVLSSVTAISDEDSQTSKMRGVSLLLSKPLPELRDLPDIAGSMTGRPNPQSRHSTLPSIGPAQPSATFSAQPLLGARLSPNLANAIKRKPPPPAQRQGSHSPGPSPMHLNAPRRASAFVRTPSSERARSPGIDSAWKASPSRFSALPYATMNAETSTQPNINALPIISPPSAPAVSTNQHSSVPEQDEDENTLMSLVSSQSMTTTRQSSAELELVQDEAEEATSDSRRESQARTLPDSLMPTDKPLPLAPPEMSASDDRIAHLNATLSGLAHRRINTIKSIQQMTELIPSDNLLRRSDLVKKRELEKKKVDGLKEELYEIQRQEHELGLKLHRAYKRQEREAAFEPTTLWVRRKAGEWIDE